MPDLKRQPPSRPPALTRSAIGPGHTRTLQSANKEALHLLGLPMDTTGDPKGRVLRQLRLQLGIDPSLLATQACMSLSQLYELEDGGNSRFYSDSLRRQAGRRVARILGADWDRMELEERKQALTGSNVVPLQRPVTFNPGHVPLTPEIVEVKVRVQTDNGHAVTMQADPVTPPLATENQAVSMGLSAPASETLLVEPEPIYYTPISAPVDKKISIWTTVITLLLVIAAGVGGAYAFVEYSPYRLYWPW